MGLTPPLVWVNLRAGLTCAWNVVFFSAQLCEFSERLWSSRRRSTMAVFGNFCPKNAREHNQIILLWNDQVMVVIFVLFLIMYYILFLPRKSVLVCFFAVWPPLPANWHSVPFLPKKCLTNLKKQTFMFNNQISIDFSTD